MLSINAAQGFELIDGFASTELNGSENNLRSYGVSGGISNGNDLVFRVAFKPVSTIRKPQEAKNTEGETVILEAAGRHDPCVLPRAVPIVEAMAALVLADMHLLQAR
jgi:chorismate synthase